MSTGGTYERLNTYSCVYFHFRAFARNSDRATPPLRFHSSSSDRFDGPINFIFSPREYNISEYKSWNNFWEIGNWEFLEKWNFYIYLWEFYWQTTRINMTFNARMKSINLILTSVVIYGSDSGSFFVCVDTSWQCLPDIIDIERSILHRSMIRAANIGSHSTADRRDREELKLLKYFDTAW